MGFPGSPTRDAGPAWTPSAPVNLATGSYNVTPGTITGVPTDADRLATIDDLFLAIGSTALSITIQDTAANVLFGPMPFPASWSGQISFRNRLQGGSASRGKALQIVASAGGNVTAFCSWHEE